jgi:hypothetical protein
VRIREDPESSLARLREICLHLPGVTERLSHGEPTWFVRRSFVMYADHHHDDRLACWCAAPVGNQEELVAADPDRFFVPPYVGGRVGWASASTHPWTGSRSPRSFLMPIALSRRRSFSQNSTGKR